MEKYTGVDSAFVSKPACLNAYDIISLSPGFNLSGLFKDGVLKQEESRFTSTQPASSIMSKLEEIASLFRFSFKKSKDFKMKLQGSEQGRKGQKGQNQNRHSSPENCAPKSQQFKGVRQRKWGKWVSKIRILNSNNRIWLGSYDTPEKAARAYDFAAYCLRGSKARLNFPVYPPEIPDAPFLTRPQIQSVAVKYAAEEFRPPSEVGVASSSSHLEAECGMDGQQITVEQVLHLEFQYHLHVYTVASL